MWDDLNCLFEVFLSYMVNMPQIPSVKVQSRHPCFVRRVISQFLTVSGLSKSTQATPKANLVFLWLVS